MTDLKYIFISWASNCSRSDNIAREFNGNSYMIYYSIFGSNYFSILFKYLFQCIESFILLLREKPDVVFVMNPPIFSCVSPWFYSKILHKTGFITDSHTAAFRQMKWKVLFPLQKFFFRNAISNIVTNRNHAEIVRMWGGNYSIIGDIPVRYFNMRPYKKMANSFNITLVNSFDDTEPVDKVLKAAEQIEDVTFYITGNLKNADNKTLSDSHRNAIFTDFLPYDQYAWLLKNSDVVMTQSTIDNTMQRGAYEAMSLETPIITSDWGILRETFYKGTVFVENDVDAIIQGILEMKRNYEKYKREIGELKKERLEIWNRNKELLLAKIRKFGDQ